MAEEKEVSGRKDLFNPDVYGSGIMDFKAILNDRELWDLLNLDETELTGSRAWRTAAEDSDYDLICSQETFEKIMGVIGEHRLIFRPHKYYSSIYIQGLDGMFNIIALDKHELQSWLFATRAMKAFKKFKLFPEGFFKNKDKVYGLFQMFKAIRRLINEA